MERLHAMPRACDAATQQQRTDAHGQDVVAVRRVELPHRVPAEHQRQHGAQHEHVRADQEHDAAEAQRLPAARRRGGLLLRTCAGWRAGGASEDSVRNLLG